jgi:Holliday junction resolvase RusA-like endonuclease
MSQIAHSVDVDSEPDASIVKAVVHGEPRPEGALKIGVRRDGRRYLHHRDGADLSTWKRAIAKEFAPLVLDPVAGPVGVAATFYVRRAKAHYGTGRNSGQLRPSAPVFPTARVGGDIDKLARAVLDALTGVCYVDDSQVIELHLRKLYANSGAVRAHIGVVRLDGKAFAPRAAAPAATVDEGRPTRVDVLPSVRAAA